MFYAVCTACGAPSVAEVVRIDDDYVFFRCANDHELFRSVTEFPAENVELAREWLYLRETYPQGLKVRIRLGRNPYRQVEVVGHKEQSLKTGRPAVRVYVKGYGAMLFGRVEMDRWNTQKAGN